MRKTGLKPKIIVTGGCGYIGSHTWVDLVENGFEVIAIDNHLRSTPNIISGIMDIVYNDEAVSYFNIDLCNLELLKEVFIKHKNIAGIIHFAALKTVPESVANPLLYYHNNIASLVNIMKCVEEFKIPNFIFSSSCSVYGNSKDLPVTEETILPKAESPYGYTKQIGEQLLKDFTSVNKFCSVIALRYFNPVGAHPSNLIGEIPFGKPNNLVPYITQTAAGKLPQLTVYGGDYNTKDGTCVRDYVHVMDIASAHTLALKFLMAKKNKKQFDIFNLGTGKGITVLEVIKAFEKISKQKLNYKIGKRRAGDAEAIYANNNKAKKILGWKIKYDLEAMMKTAWDWERTIADC